MPIEPALEALRRRLLDLTRRNRLLHLPPGARTVLRVVDERPAQVWAVVVDEERPLRLLAREEADPALRARLDAAVADARARGVDEEGGLVLPPPAPPPTARRGRASRSATATARCRRRWRPRRSTRGSCASSAPRGCTSTSRAPTSCT